MKEPDQTCPTINACVKAVQNALNDIISMDNVELFDTRDNLKDALAILEDIRNANSDLREWGQYYKDLHADIVSELDLAEERIVDLEEDISNLNKQVDYLDEQLNRYQEEEQ